MRSFKEEVKNFFSGNEKSRKGLRNNINEREFRTGSRSNRGFMPNNMR